MPSVWDAHANTNLLISINEIQNPKPPNWKDVAEKMKAKGYVGFTNEACRYVHSLSHYYDYPLLRISGAGALEKT